MRWVVYLPLAAVAAPLAFAGPVTVPAGDASYHFSSGSSQPGATIPAGLFGPGSEPFTGVISWSGIPQVPPAAPATADFTPAVAAGATWFGFSPLSPPVFPGPDTIVRRNGQGLLPDAGQTTVPIELLQLSLQSVAPITITFSGPSAPPASFFDVFYDLPFQPQGSMTLNRTGSTNGGTFTATLPVQARLTFVPVGGGQNVVYVTGDTFTYSGDWRVPDGPIPEPSSWIFVASGTALLGGFALKRSVSRRLASPAGLTAPFSCP